jgi:hypothetical protein
MVVQDIKLKKMVYICCYPLMYTTQQVKDEINLFGANACKSIAMEAYDICHISQNITLRQHLKPGSGNYWSMLQIAFDSEFNIIEDYI